MIHVYVPTWYGRSGRGEFACTIGLVTGAFVLSSVLGHHPGTTVEDVIAAACGEAITIAALYAFVVSSVRRCRDCGLKPGLAIGGYAFLLVLCLTLRPHWAAGPSASVIHVAFVAYLCLRKSIVDLPAANDDVPPI